MTLVHPHIPAMQTVQTHTLTSCRCGRGHSVARLRSARCVGRRCCHSCHIRKPGERRRRWRWWSRRCCPAGRTGEPQHQPPCNNITTQRRSQGDQSWVRTSVNHLNVRGLSWGWGPGRTKKRTQKIWGTLDDSQISFLFGFFSAHQTCASISSFYSATLSDCISPIRWFVWAGVSYWFTFFPLLTSSWETDLTNQGLLPVCTWTSNIFFKSQLWDLKR